MLRELGPFSSRMCGPQPSGTLPSYRCQKHGKHPCRILASTVSTSKRMRVTILNPNGWLFSQARTRSTSVIGSRKSGSCFGKSSASQFLQACPSGDPVFVTRRAWRTQGPALRFASGRCKTHRRTAVEAFGVKSPVIATPAICVDRVAHI
jgi:hypothetical protein